MFRRRSRLSEARRLSVVVLGVVLAPLMARSGPLGSADETAPNPTPRSLDEIDRELQQLDARLAQKQAELGDNKAQIIAHNAALPDQTDEIAVNAYNAEAERLEQERARLKGELAYVENGRAGLTLRRDHLLDEIRLEWLRGQIPRLDKQIADLEARIQRTQALLERLKGESLRDVAEIEGVAREFQAADQALALEILDLMTKLMTEVKAVSKGLHGVKLTQFPGDEWKELREAIMEARSAVKVFESPEAAMMLKRAHYSIAVLKKAPGAVTSGELDKAISECSKIMQWTASELGYRTEAGQAIVKRVPALRGLDKAIPGYGKGPNKITGSTLLRQSAYALDLGERAINLWAIRGEQILANRDVNRITDAIDRRNRIVKEFSPGGSYFKTYQQEIFRLKAARDEKAQMESEITGLESRLDQASSRSKSTPP